MKQYFKDNPAICSEIEQLIRQKASHANNTVFDSEILIGEEE